MPRTARIAPGGYVFHALNRGNGRMRLFDDEGDYAAFEKALAEALLAVPVRLLAYCLMPNHWHLLLWPARDGDMGRVMHRLTVTHARRWHAHRHSEGAGGHVYQGPYKSFPVQDDAHFPIAARYVERNPSRAGLVARAEDWRWSSLWRRERGQPADRAVLAEWPVPRPADWRAWVNRPQTPGEEDAMRESIRRGRPFGADAWQRATAAALGLQSSFRTPGRPRKVLQAGGKT